MKLLAAMSVFGMMASSAAMADHSAAITAEGINVYTITQKGVDLVKGSPYVLPQPGVAYPLTPQLIAISPAHDFLYVVYELQPFQGNPTEDVTVIGFAITDQGLVKKWSYPLNMDPAEYVNIALDVGLDTVIQYYRPGNDNRYAIITNEQGTTIATDGSYEPGTNEDHLVSGRVAAYDKFYYSCRVSAATVVNGIRTPGAPYVDVYALNPQHLLLSSYDPVFMHSVCN